MVVIFMANATIYDVAGAARVSLATVSRVLNNPEKVNEETRKRVLEVIKQLGYRPNAIARGLASRKTTTVGVIVSDITRASVSQMIGGIMDIARQYKYSIKIFSMGEDSDVYDVVRSVVAEQVDGILLLNDELDDKDMKTVVDCISDSNIPLVLSNVVNSEYDLPSVNIDYEKASYDTTKEMIALGRKNIYLLSTVRKYTTNEAKEVGYSNAMKEAGLDPKIFRTSGDLSINTQHFKAFFDVNPVDAVMAVRDSIAVSFVNVARDANKRIPEDILVVGFQNTKYAELSRPSLTCIDNPVYDIGAVSMRLLTKFMQSETVDSSKVVLPHTLVRRQTM